MSEGVKKGWLGIRVTVILMNPPTPSLFTLVERYEKGL